MTKTNPNDTCRLEKPSGPELLLRQPGGLAQSEAKARRVGESLDEGQLKSPREKRPSAGRQELLPPNSLRKLKLKCQKSPAAARELAAPSSRLPVPAPSGERLSLRCLARRTPD